MINMDLNAKSVSKEVFKELLSALCNIGEGVCPEEDEGIVFSESASLMANALFITKKQIQRHLEDIGYTDVKNIRDEDILAGQINAVALWLEYVLSNDPEKFAKVNCELGWDGNRIFNVHEYIENYNNCGINK